MKGINHPLVEFPLKKNFLSNETKRNETKIIVTERETANVGTVYVEQFVKNNLVTREMTMSEEGSFSGCSKARSASICAPGCSSMEALVMNSQLPPSGSGTPDTGTPSGRRRRPAARSQVNRFPSFTPLPSLPSSPPQINHTLNLNIFTSGKYH